MCLDREWRLIGWCGKTRMPWFFWCYPFKKEVFRIINISSNRLTSDVTYISYYAKLYFTTIQKAMHLNNDGLFLGQRALKVWPDILSSLQMCIISLVKTTQFVNHGIKIVLWWCPHKRLPKWFGNWCLGCHLTIIGKWSLQKTLLWVER